MLQTTSSLSCRPQRSLAKWNCKLLKERGRLNTRQNSSICKKCSQKKYRSSTVPALNQQWCLYKKWKPGYPTGSLKYWDVSAEALEVPFYLCWLENTSDYIQILQLSGNGIDSEKKKSNSWYLWPWILSPRFPDSTPCHRKVSHSRKITEISNNKDVKWQLQKWGGDREIFTGKFTLVVGNMPT